MPGRKCWIPLPAPGGAVRGPQNVAVIRMPMLQVQTMAPAPTMSATLLTATSFMSCLSEEGNRFSRVYNGENWNPQLRAPLTSPGVNVKAGEYLLAVNGREVRPPENVYSFFEGQADKSVLLRVGGDPNGAGAREVTVVPVADEGRLRNLAWIEENRRKVDQM